MEQFENFIIKCCEMDEWDLRNYLKTALIEAGFFIREDNYVSQRPGKYKTIKNMLAIRGTKPQICLVAHTDVCRDHSYNRKHTKAEPVIKYINKYGQSTKIIQDKNCQVQVGGDDRLGVAINTWIALNTGYDMGLLFTTDEEIGAVSADHASFTELRDFEVLVQVDRGNHSDQLVTNIYGVQLCNNQVAKRLLSIAKKIELPRVPVSGLLTDVYALTLNGMCKNAVNMTCGYHCSSSSSPNEYIDVIEAYSTLEYVSNIIQDYEMENIERLNQKPINFKHLSIVVAT